MLNHSKIDPIKVQGDFPQSLREQIQNFNKLLIQDEFHRTADLSVEEEAKFLDARYKLLRAKGALLDACTEHYEKVAEENKREFWKKTVKSVLSIGASFIYLIYTLLKAGYETSTIVLILVGAGLVCAALVYWITKD
jgi:uncharacterized membrane protein YciS (DUF1049 family)